MRTAEIWCLRAGLVSYEEARLAQRRLKAARLVDEIPDLLLLLEHPPVYTRGRRSTPEELPMGEEWYRERGIEVRDTDRGGRVTYHGPGQLVGYPIVSLRPYGGVRDYIRRMERAVIAALADHGVGARTIDGLTGVWAGSAKIASIGVHVSRRITTHGFAINVDCDLEPFEWIVPCGIEACRVTSVARELGAEPDAEGFATSVRDRFAEVYERRPVEVGPGDLRARLDGVEALAGAPAAVA